jgi:hypothetical protein
MPIIQPVLTMSSSHHVKFEISFFRTLRSRDDRADSFQYAAATLRYEHCIACPSSNFISAWHVVIFRWSYSILYSFSSCQAGTANRESVTAVLISCHENLCAPFRLSDGATSVAQADAGPRATVCDLRILYAFSF